MLQTRTIDGAEWACTADGQPVTALTDEDQRERDLVDYARRRAALDELHALAISRPAPMSGADQRYAWHSNGVHLRCEPAACDRAGTVDRFHSHDFDGPLPGCCDEFAS